MGDHAVISSETIAEVVESMHSGFLITDQTGVVLYCNDAYKNLTKLYDLQVGDCILKYRENGWIKEEPACIAVIRERRKIIRQFVQRGDGVFIVSSSEPVIEADGTISKVITRVHDMTEFIGIRDDIEQVRMIMEAMSRHPKSIKDYGENIVALSPSMIYALDMAEKVSGFDFSVLMTGESGVGKDVVARFIHERSPRSKEPFIAVNCAAIPAELLETELFGYGKGTFTGQKSNGKEGLFSAAGEGTLFLDEIGDMPLELQAKILRVLEARQFRPVGSNNLQKMNARVLSATNHDLKKMIEEGKFREDLYYRIKVVELKIPALRERREDIVPLTLFFLHRNNEKYKMNKSISVVELQKLQAYDWPGNIRELKNMVEMMYALSKGDLLEAPMGSRKYGSYSKEDTIKVMTTATGSWIQPRSGDIHPVSGGWKGGSDLPEETKSGAGGESPNTLEIANPEINSASDKDLMTLESFMDENEKAYLVRAYRICGTTRKMAEVLGVNHSTIMRKLKKYSISSDK